MGKTFKVVLVVSTSEDHIKKISGDLVDDLESYVENEIGWLNQSFESVRIQSIEDVTNGFG